jgi:hypothetical protein
MKYELLGSERRALAELRLARTVGQATTYWERGPSGRSGFERAGVVAMGSRIRRANALNQSYLESAPATQQSVPVPRPHQDFVPSNIGAATAANVANHHSTVNSHNRTAHEVNIAALNVHTAATDASGIVRDIKPAIERTNFAMLGNYSLA